MPKVAELKESRYLRKEDVGNGLTVTITGSKKENVAPEGQEEENRWCLTFKEAKPLVLNVTNGEIIAELLGSDEIDDWTGKQIELYNDPTIMFGGKRTGGIRARAAKGGEPF